LKAIKISLSRRDTEKEERPPSAESERKKHGRSVDMQIEGRKEKNLRKHRL